MKQSMKEYIAKHSCFHLIGIGGVSMSSLAELLLSYGASVTGSDRTRSDVTARLEGLGATIYYAHAAENVRQATVVIRTAAVHDDNPEIVQAHALSIPVMERAEAWGELMADYQQTICVAGTHGKTTTTSMMTLLTMKAELNPTVMVGSHLPAIDGTLRIGGKDYFIAESCEYCNSFLYFDPTIAMILNLEADHLDFFSGIEEIIASFHQFCLRTRSGGAIVVNADDANAMLAVKGISRPILTFGKRSSAYAHPVNIRQEHGYYHFTAIADGSPYAQIELAVPGEHNMMNALACIAAAKYLGIPGEAVAAGLAAFTGSTRRFQRTGTLSCGAVVVDDYAHHPSEMRATLMTARQMDFARIICVFQPHTYTRTKALFDDFVEALKLSDKVVLAPIYAAREQNTIGISSADLARNLPDAACFGSYEAIAEHIRDIAQAGDLILTMGAGPVDAVGRLLCPE